MDTLTGCSQVAAAEISIKTQVPARTPRDGNVGKLSAQWFVWTALCIWCICRNWWYRGHLFFRSLALCLSPYMHIWFVILYSSLDYLDCMCEFFMCSCVCQVVYCIFTNVIPLFVLFVSVIVLFLCIYLKKCNNSNMAFIVIYAWKYYMHMICNVCVCVMLFM